ncbi:MAG TPA: ABC transporter permease [Bryobacteraceae bacterium]|nr:ABC transporter permease [Bryobacteraceae bacterium]
MKTLAQFFFSYRVRALLRKEFAQMRRDRRLVMSLVVFPTLQLLLFTLVLNATVSNLKLGIIDDSRTPESRGLTSTLTESKSFKLAGYYYSVEKLGEAISHGDVDAGVVIPFTYARDLQRGRPVTVQLLLNAMNANTAAIAQGYAEGVIQTYNAGLTTGGLHAKLLEIPVSDISRRGVARLSGAYLYNPGLVASWFVVTGIFGLLLLMNGAMVAATSMVKEREAGTIEQLLMSPAGTYEIIVAKIAPLFVVLFLMVVFAIVLIKLAFDVPFQGGISIVLSGAALCVLSGIGLGTVIATFTHSAFQAQLTSFFVNPLLTTASGAVTPAEAIPNWLQPLVKINPIRHFSQIARSSMIKGSGFESLWPDFLVLGIFTLIMVSASVWRFRKQLS